MFISGPVEPDIIFFKLAKDAMVDILDRFAQVDVGMTLLKYIKFKP